MWYSFLAKLLGINQALAQAGNPGGSGGLNLEDPFGGGTITEILENILGGLRALATPVAIIMVLVGAFYFLTSGGNEDRIKRGKSILLYAVVGYGIILMAEGIMLIIKEVITG